MVILFCSIRSPRLLMPRTKILIVPESLRTKAGERGINCDGHNVNGVGSVFIPLSNPMLIDSATRFALDYPGATIR